MLVLLANRMMTTSTMSLAKTTRAVLSVRVPGCVIGAMEAERCPAESAVVPVTRPARCVAAVATPVVMRMVLKYVRSAAEQENFPVSTVKVQASRTAMAVTAPGSVAPAAAQA